MKGGLDGQTLYTLVGNVLVYEANCEDGSKNWGGRTKRKI